MVFQLLYVVFHLMSASEWGLSFPDTYSITLRCVANFVRTIHHYKKVFKKNCIKVLNCNHVDNTPLFPKTLNPKQIFLTGSLKKALSHVKWIRGDLAIKLIYHSRGRRLNSPLCSHCGWWTPSVVWGLAACAPGHPHGKRGAAGWPVATPLCEACLGLRGHRHRKTFSGTSWDCYHGLITETAVAFKLKRLDWILKERAENKDHRGLKNRPGQTMKRPTCQCFDIPVSSVESISDYKKKALWRSHSFQRLGVECRGTRPPYTEQ